MMHVRLFGSCSWLADREACGVLSQKLDDLGLQERVTGYEDTSQNTALGQELQLDLVMVFIGLWNELEVPIILERHGLIDEIEETRIYDQMGAGIDPEYLLRPLVKRAFLDHYNPSGLLV